MCVFVVFFVGGMLLLVLFVDCFFCVWAFRVFVFLFLFCGLLLLVCLFFCGRFLCVCACLRCYVADLMFFACVVFVLRVCVLCRSWVLACVAKIGLVYVLWTFFHVCCY